MADLVSVESLESILKWVETLRRVEGEGFFRNETCLEVVGKTVLQGENLVLNLAVQESSDPPLKKQKANSTF